MTDEYAPSHVRCACLYNTHTKTAVIVIGKTAVNGIMPDPALQFETTLTDGKQKK
jgi:hypothetical protein